MTFLTALMRKPIASSLLACSISLLVACGQKGPLYFPEETPPPNEPFSACDAPEAPCRNPSGQASGATPYTQSFPDSGIVPGATSTESTAP